MSGNKINTVALNPRDNVRIALRDFAAGERIDEIGVTLACAIPRGHKIASSTLATGEYLYRYGQVIGVAETAIAVGDHVHVHNCGMVDHPRDSRFSKQSAPLSSVVLSPPRTFRGYRRANGRAGTRNYIGIVSSVNCSGSVARFIAAEAEKSDWFAACENVDGIVPITHASGCGMATNDEGYGALFRTLSGYARHPNFGGVLLLGLGCEVMQVVQLLRDGNPVAEKALRHMTIQHTGGTLNTVRDGVQVVRELIQQANNAVRESVPISNLCVGMQCGGSDGYSGITANPALGFASDLLVRHGGTTILSETPEIYGAEHLLRNRALSEEVADKLDERIRWWEAYTRRNGVDMNNNPSPGNKRGGLTTILEKSLGAVAKGGTAPLKEVYQFAERIDKCGFVFMDSPGYDPCSVTGQIAAGANLIAFTTGRGSVSGYKPTPCIKLATNSEVYTRMMEDMDINCGDIVDEGVSIEQKGEGIFEHFLQIASGEKTQSEQLGFGDVEFVPWQIGAVM